MLGDLDLMGTCLVAFFAAGLLGLVRGLAVFALLVRFAVGGLVWLRRGRLRRELLGRL